MPVRNAEGTLQEAIESCLRQSFQDFELIVVLNGCVDRSEEIAVSHAAIDPRLRVMSSEERGGVIGAMQAGMECGAAPVVMRMDADDLSHPQRVARQWELLQSDPHLGAVSCAVRLKDPVGEGMMRYVEWVNGLERPEDVSRERFVECPVIQPSLMMRKEAVAQAGGYRECGWAEDHDLFLRMLEAGIRFGKVPEVLLDWRDSPGRLTRTHPAYREDRVWELKAHYLARQPVVRERGVALCGAGPIGKRLARLLEQEGVRLRGFFEVNPRRIGERIAGVEVAGPDQFGIRWREAVLLSAVGVPGGRDRVRALAKEAGYCEGSDFWCCC